MATFKTWNRRKIQKRNYLRKPVNCRGSQEKSWFPEGGNAECCWLAKDSRRVQGALGFHNSMEVTGDGGRVGSVEWLGEH